MENQIYKDGEQDRDKANSQTTGISTALIALITKEHQVEVSQHYYKRAQILKVLSSKINVLSFELVATGHTTDSISRYTTGCRYHQYYHIVVYVVAMVTQRAAATS